MYWMEWTIEIVVANGVCVAVYAAMTRMMRRAVAEKQRETDRQLSAVAATVSALQARVAELGGLQAKQAESAAVAAKDVEARKQEASEAETVAVLTAAAATFLGKKTRIRSAQVVPAEQSGAGTWAQQGRAFVQTSHNPRSRG